MILSHKYKFIFVKTFKTAGTSVEVFLSQVCGPLDIVTPIEPHVEPHVARNYQGYFNHIPAAEIRDHIDPHVWSEYFKFCVERNPWDKTLSHYHMNSLRQGGGLSLENFLMQGDFPINYPKYTEPEDPHEVIVDRVIYYESLLEGLGQTFRELAVPFEGSLGVNAKSDYRKDRRPYRQVYTDAQASKESFERGPRFFVDSHFLSPYLYSSW